MNIIQSILLAMIDGIAYSRYISDRYEVSEIMDESINTEHWEAYPFIAPDESYLMFVSNRPGGLGSSDLYICYKMQDGAWTEPINLGSSVNSERWDAAPRISPDGKYLFFCSSRENNYNNYCKIPLNYQDVILRNTSAGNGTGDVFWVDAKIIENLKPKRLK